MGGRFIIEKSLKISGCVHSQKIEMNENDNILADFLADFGCLQKTDFTSKIRPNMDIKSLAIRNADIECLIVSMINPTIIVRQHNQGARMQKNMHNWEDLSTQNARWPNSCHCCHLLSPGQLYGCHPKGFTYVLCMSQALSCQD